jgi:hypothetical protein
MPLLRFHPLFQLLYGVVDTVRHGNHFGEQALVAGAVAVVLADGVHDGVQVLIEHSFQCIEVILALFQAGNGVLQVAFALFLERCQQVLRDCSGGFLPGRFLGIHHFYGFIHGLVPGCGPCILADAM